ncbi:MAG: hypothetical protein R6W75_05340 [Smithellaceae bacterium]
MTAVSAARQEKQESLCEELMRERAAVLSRAGRAVEDALDRAMTLHRIIESQIAGLQNGVHDACAQDTQSLFEHVNETIEQFNDARRKAELRYYYLIVTREALGLRKHDMVSELYQIPPRRKRIQAA